MARVLFRLARSALVGSNLCMLSNYQLPNEVSGFTITRVPARYCLRAAR
ncbi:MAG: hypothetical protein ACRD3C_21080 [Vicinamibacterales bacterium]